MNSSASLEHHHSRSQSVTVDFIGRLLPFPHLLEKIFEFLKPKDLRVVPVVSSRWRDALYHITPKASRRRHKALLRLKKLKRQVGSENWPINCTGVVAKRRRRQTEEAQLVQQQQPNPPQPQLRRSLRTLATIQNLNTANYKLPASRMSRQLCLNDSENNDFFDDGKKKKSSRWSLAQAPFKPW